MRAVTPGVKKAIGYTILCLLAIYVTLSLVLTLFPGAVVVNRKATKYYRWLAMPGPFFTESRIQKPVFVVVAYKQAGGGWADVRDPQREFFQQFQDSFFDYNSLLQSRVSHQLVKEVVRAYRAAPTAVQHSRALRRLHAHLGREYVPAEADSVRLVFLRERDDGDVSRKETLFTLIYKSF